MIIESYDVGVPSWVDLITADQDSAIAFYCDLFGWQAMKFPEMGGYAMCMKNDQAVAGIGPLPDDMPIPAAWRMYVNVADADAVAAAAVDAGGNVVFPVMTVEGGGQKPGRMAAIADPTGGIFGIWEPHEHKGSGLANEPGSFTWNELLSTDPATSREFLTKLFGYEWDTMPGIDMEYHMAKVNDRPILGLMAMPPGVPGAVPSYWNNYFAVDDTNDTVARAVAGGAEILHEPMDSPFGRMAVLADSEGAVFSIVALAPPA